MSIDEGVVMKNGECLSAQCLLEKRSTQYVVEYHYHRYMEFIYMLEGNLCAHIGDKTYTLNPGDFFLVYPNEPHTYTNEGAVKYIVIKFFTDILHTREPSMNEFEYVFNLNIFNNRHSRIIEQCKPIGKLMHHSYDMFANGGYTSELYIRADILCICANVLEYWKSKGEISSVENNISTENVKIIRELIEYVKKNNFIKTCVAAKKCGMSEGYFTRVFKSLTGITFTKYVKILKMEQADRLLKCTGMPITDIAMELSYATASSFIEDFKKEKGVSPKKYRKFASDKING